MNRLLLITFGMLFLSGCGTVAKQKKEIESLQQYVKDLKHDLHYCLNQRDKLFKIYKNQRRLLREAEENPDGGS